MLSSHSNQEANLCSDHCPLVSLRVKDAYLVSPAPELPWRQSRALGLPSHPGHASFSLQVLQLRPAGPGCRMGDTLTPMMVNSCHLHEATVREYLVKDVSFNVFVDEINF